MHGHMYTRTALACTPQQQRLRSQGWLTANHTVLPVQVNEADGVCTQKLVVQSTVLHLPPSKPG